MCELAGELGGWVTDGHKVCGQFEELKKSPILNRVTQSGDASPAPIPDISLRHFGLPRRRRRFYEIS